MLANLMRLRYDRSVLLLKDNQIYSVCSNCFDCFQICIQHLARTCSSNSLYTAVNSNTVLCVSGLFEQTLRSLENRLDKAELKCKEAEHIQRTYMQIKEKLEKEHENHSNMLDDGENEIRRLLVVTHLRVLLCVHSCYLDIFIVVMLILFCLLW